MSQCVREKIQRNLAESQIAAADLALQLARLGIHLPRLAWRRGRAGSRTCSGRSSS